ncbi:MAG: hypothetical protein WKF84_16980 [Pyrinomonadaceae bacterium]
MDADRETRDRVRALVRDVLKNAQPSDDERAEEEGASVGKKTLSAAASTPAPLPTELPFARDESAKQVITEDDVRGLEEGARLRIAESARLTPLACRCRAREAH